MEDIAVLIIAYVLFCLVILFPPNEVISAGLTIDKLFSRFLGDEQMQFVHFHIRRTSLTVFIHSCLPLFFFVMLEWKEPDVRFLYDYPSLPGPWRFGIVFSLLLPIAAGSLVAYWFINNWSNHPIVRVLSLYNADWEGVAATIESEFRRVDKFSVQLGGVRKVVVTDSWVLFASSYKLEFSQQADIRLTVVQTDEHDISHHSDARAQFLNIRVDNIAKPVPSFTIRLNSLNYGDLRQKLQRPVETARDIIVHQTRDEEFVLAFVQQATENPTATMSPEEISVLDQCLGCGAVRSDVKLEKNCVDVAEEERDENGEVIPHCRQCYCRPMWCVSCMGRWFASRQDPHRPERWLGGKSPCPTCRAIFCVLDVSIVPSEPAANPAQ